MDEVPVVVTKGELLDRLGENISRPDKESEPDLESEPVPDAEAERDPTSGIAGRSSSNGESFMPNE
jgi:hypothetical protein